MIRLLIVDDHPLIRQALIRTIHHCEDVELVGEAENGQEAVEKARSLRPDVIIMDLALPGKPGIDAIREILEEQGEIRILVLSGKEDTETITKAIQAGAIGFLGKGEENIDLVRGIRDTYRGMATLRGEIIRGLILPKQTFPEKEAFVHLLSDRELEVLEKIAAGCSDHEIGEALLLADSTVRSHVKHILNKLGLDSRTSLIRLIMKVEAIKRDVGEKNDGQ